MATETAPASTATATAVSSQSSESTAAPASSSQTGEDAAAVAAEPAKAPTLAEIKAARRAAPKSEASPASAASPAASATPPKPAEPAKPTEGDKPTTAQIDMDGDALKNFTELNRQLREAKTKTKNLEERIAGFGRFEKAQALAKDGKHYDAAREAGIDVDAALAELLGQRGGDPTASQIDRELKARVDALEADKLARDKEADDRKKAAAATAVEDDRKITSKFVGDNAATFPYLAKSPRLVGMAFQEYADVKAKQEAEESRELTGEENVRLMLATLRAHEADSAKEFGPAPALAAKTEETDEGSAGLEGGARSGVRQPAASAPKKVTWEELKRERAAKRARA